MQKASAKCRRLLRGGDGEVRTLDLRVANAALSQLSYAPVSGLRVSEALFDYAIILPEAAFVNRFTRFFAKRRLYQLYNGHLGRVAATGAGLEYAGITAVALGVLGGYLLKELLDDALLGDVS